jgi:UDP-N-acetyl-D-mannosaminuronate dehydrogenase
VVDMQQTLINSGGTLEVKESHGNVNIIGWEQPQIEVTVTKSTSRRFTREDIDQAIAELDRIVVTTDHVSDNHVVIRTQLPSPNGYIRTAPAAGRR